MDRWFHSYASDFSVWELWGLLPDGGRLAVVPYETSFCPDWFLVFKWTKRGSTRTCTPIGLTSPQARPTGTTPRQVRVVAGFRLASSRRRVSSWAGWLIGISVPMTLLLVNMCCGPEDPPRGCHMSRPMRPVVAARPARVIGELIPLTSPCRWMPGQPQGVAGSCTLAGELVWAPRLPWPARTTAERWFVAVTRAREAVMYRTGDTDADQYGA